MLPIQDNLSRLRAGWRKEVTLRQGEDIQHKGQRRDRVTYYLTNGVVIVPDNKKADGFSVYFMFIFSVRDHDLTGKKGTRLKAK